MILEDKRTRSLGDRENSEFPGETRSIRIVLPLPPRPLWPNARHGHWGQRHRAVKAYRGRAKVETLLAMHRASLSRRPRWPAASEQARFYFRDRRPHDRDNCLAAMKAAFDGMADAGLIGNDQGLTHLPVQVAVDRARPRVEVEVQADAC